MRFVAPSGAASGPSYWQNKSGRMPPLAGLVWKIHPRCLLLPPGHTSSLAWFAQARTNKNQCIHPQIPSPRPQPRGKCGNSRPAPLGLRVSHIFRRAGSQKPALSHNAIGPFQGLLPKKGGILGHRPLAWAALARPFGGRFRCADGVPPVSNTSCATRSAQVERGACWLDAFKV